MTSVVLTIESIEKYNSLCGYRTINNDITVFDSNNAKKCFENTTIKYGFYSVFLKTGGNCSLLYGRQATDYTKGMVLSCVIGAELSINYPNKEAIPKTLGLLFSKDFLKNTILERKIKTYSFFNYFPQEALHLSDDEYEKTYAMMSDIGANITESLPYGKKVEIINQIIDLLDYISLCYSRQFSSRHQTNSRIVEEFFNLLHDYFASNKTLQYGTPTVNYFADKVCLTSGYFGDLIKKELGLNAQTIIQKKIIEEAQHYLRETDKTISQIAEQLGFQYPQHFTRMFKKATGLAPKDYKIQNKK